MAGYNLTTTTLPWAGVLQLTNSLLQSIIRSTPN